MRWRTLVLDVIPAVLLVAGIGFLFLVRDAQRLRIQQVAISPEGSYLRAIQGQPLEDPAKVMKAAEALNAAGYPIRARHVLFASEKLMLSKAGGGLVVGLPGTVGEASISEEREEGERRKLRRHVFMQLVSGVVAPRTKDAPSSIDMPDGRKIVHVADAIWKDDGSGALRVAVDVRNESASAIVDVEFRLEIDRSLAGTNAVLHCRTRDDRGDQAPRPLAAKETRRMFCRPEPEAAASEWRRTLEGVDKWRHSGRIQLVKFADAPVWIDDYSGARVPDEWPRREPYLPGKAPPVDLEGKPLDCEARGTCAHERALHAFAFAERNPHAAVVLGGIVVGLCSAGAARRVFRRTRAFRWAGIALSALVALAAVGFLVAAAMEAGAYSLFAAMIVGGFAGAAVVAWLAGFWTYAALMDPAARAN